MGIRQVDLADAWGVSRAYVNKLVKRGMPLDSLKGANDWRLAHAERGIGFRSGKAPAGAGGLQPQPTEALLEIKPDPSLEGMLTRAVEAEQAAYMRWKQAVSEGRNSELNLLQRNHLAAQKNRLEIEMAIEQRRKQAQALVSMDEAKGVIARALQPVASQLETAAQALGFRCNPTDPRLAESALQEWVADLKSLITAELEAVMRPC